MESDDRQHWQPDHRLALGWKLLIEFSRWTEGIWAALNKSPQGLALEDVAQMLTDGTGRYLLWSDEDGVVITEQIGITLNLWLAAGKMEALESLAPVLEDYARRIGAKRVTTNGRRGWERSFLKGRGYTLSTVVLVKDLEDGQ